MNFQTPYKYKGPTLEKGGGPTLTDRTGYVSLRDQVLRLQAAGVRLAEYRRQAFNADGTEETAEGISRRANAMDVLDQGRRVRTRLREQLRAAREKRDQEKREKAAAESAELERLRAAAAAAGASGGA